VGAENNYNYPFVSASYLAVTEGYAQNRPYKYTLYNSYGEVIEDKITPLEDVGGAVDGVKLAPGSTAHNLKNISQVENTPTITWAELVNKCNGREPDYGDVFYISDEGNRRVRIDYISPSGYYFYDEINDAGMLTTKRII
jgi:hypothetical protein